MKDDVAGSPMGGLRWSRKSTYKIADELRGAGIDVSANVVARLLKKMKFSLQVNSKWVESSKNPPSRKDRDAQFHYIRSVRQEFAAEGKPILSIDTKKKELIGNFKNSGRTWR